MTRGVAWNTANDAAQGRGQADADNDPARPDGVPAIGVDEHEWPKTTCGDNYVTVNIALASIREGTGPTKLLDMVEGGSKQAFKTWLPDWSHPWRNTDVIEGVVAPATPTPANRARRFDNLDATMIASGSAIQYHCIMKLESRGRHPMQVGLRYSSRLLRSRDSGLVLTILAITTGLVIFSPGFRTSENLLNTLDQWAPIGIISCAMTIALICRGLDLSAGAIYVFSGLICAKATIATDSVWIGIAAACLVGTGIGALNAFLIVKVEINAFIATLATSVIVGGLTLAIAKGYLVTVDTPGFETIGTGQLLGINISVWIFAAFAMTLWFFLRNARFGRHLYATGGAEEAARLAGVPVARIKATTYILLGFSAALAGVIIVSRTLTAQTDSVSYGVLFQVFTAVIVGGTAIHGGEGGIGRTVLGLALLAVVTNGFIFLNVAATLQQVLLGCILLVAIGYDAYLKSHEPDTTDHHSQTSLQPEEHHA